MLLLSILYLRCDKHVSNRMGQGTTTAFNSLFEMRLGRLDYGVGVADQDLSILYLRCRALLVSARLLSLRLSTFNSLFEMRAAAP